MIVRRKCIAVDLKKISHVHMVGIGGVGMSALANILMDYGIKVSGSDLKGNRLTSFLKSRGCIIKIGHGRIYGRPDCVIRSFGIHPDNPEIVEASRKGIPLIERSELLKAIIDNKGRTICVSGAHGKTTTTSMISYLMDKLGLSPTVLIGGELDYFKGNSKIGKSDIFVTETDESDGFIACLSAKYIVITNIEKEHMEYYKNMENLLESFRQFLRNAPKDGVLLYYKNDKNIQKVLNSYKGRRISYGTGNDCDFRAEGIKLHPLSSNYDLYYKGRKLGNVLINVPGKHNVLNSMASIGMLMEFGINFSKAQKIMPGFRSAKRRFEIQSDLNGTVLIEDYAHHPTEIKAVLGIAEKVKAKRLVAVFQPHRYTRTMHLKNGFAKCFKKADHVFITDIYAANEKPIKGVSTKNIIELARKNGFKNMRYIKKEGLVKFLKGFIKKGDLILVLGAGDINQIIPDIKSIIRSLNFK